MECFLWLCSPWPPWVPPCHPDTALPPQGKGSQAASWAPCSLPLTGRVGGSPARSRSQSKLPVCIPVDVGPLPGWPWTGASCMDPGLGSHLSHTAHAGGQHCLGGTPGCTPRLCMSRIENSAFQGAATAAPADPWTYMVRSPWPTAPNPVTSLFHGLLPAEAGTSLENVFVRISLLSPPQGSLQDECRCTFRLTGLGAPLPTGRGHGTLKRLLARSGSSLPPAALGVTACPGLQTSSSPAAPGVLSCFLEGDSDVPLCSPEPRPQWRGGVAPALRPLATTASEAAAVSPQ